MKKLLLALTISLAISVFAYSAHSAEYCIATDQCVLFTSMDDLAQGQLNYTPVAGTSLSSQSMNSWQLAG